jgi:ankyrin repeat protein
MCTILSDNIITFDVCGTIVKIPTERLALYPESLLTTMVHNKVQPASGFFVDCCPEIFVYILRFVLYDIQVDPMMLAEKIGTDSGYVRTIIEKFKFKGIFITELMKKEEKKEEVKEEEKLDTKKKEAEALYKRIWSIAKKGEYNSLKLIIEHGFDLEIRCCDYGSTALMYAAQSGQLACVQLLIDNGANVQATNTCGRTAVHFASSSDIINVLVKNGANVNAVSKDGDTPLHEAFTVGRINSTIRALISNGADINKSNKLGRTPLHLALKFPNDTTLILELFTKDVDLTLKTHDGNTLLHFTACKSLDLTKHLLQLGADPNVTNNSGDTPLIVASKNGKHDIVAMMYDHMINKK